MPISDTLENKAKAKLMRDYVWSDFSIVEKARIQIIRSKETIGSCIPGSKNELYLDCELPVQINPDRFNEDYFVNPLSITRKLTNGKTAEGFVLNAFGEHDRSSLDIPLTFDIYGEYMARSVNGAMTKDFSLMNEKATSLPMLIKFAKEGNVYARFIWGDIRKFGLLTGVTQVEYSAFSPWGQPLKATAHVQITEQITPANLKIPGEAGFSTVETNAKKLVTGIQNMFR